MLFCLSLFRNPCVWVMYCKTPKIRKYTRGFLNELFSLTVVSVVVERMYD
nr:MAG TPA: hypothetical protein [Caudoviricetes sp.]